MGRSSADVARTLASGFATCSGDAYEMGDVIGVGGFGRCVVVLRASASALDVCSRRVPARLPASRLTLASSLVASSSRSVRACCRRDDTGPSPRPLAVKAVRLAPSPRDVRSAGAESSAGPRPPNPAERLAAEIDALRRVASTASDFVGARDETGRDPRPLPRRLHRIAPHLRRRLLGGGFHRHLERGVARPHSGFCLEQGMGGACTVVLWTVCCTHVSGDSGGDDRVKSVSLCVGSRCFVRVCHVSRSGHSGTR